MKTVVPSDTIGHRLISLKYFLVTDIDNTLIGEDNSQLNDLIALLKQNRKNLGFGVATGRTIESAQQFLKKHHVPEPDIFISSVGSEIYYGIRNHFSQGWATHINHHWQRAKIVSLLKNFGFLSYQEEEAQREFKISYYMKPGKERLARIHDKLLSNRVRYNLIYSHNQFLDILPARASKGKAIRYLSYKWVIPLSHFIVSGDSGNDEEMLRGEPYGIVVGNYSSELENLRKNRHIYFAKKSTAGGILEGLQHYHFIDDNGVFINDTSK
jgi:sucrose-phosphate synthase